MSEEYDLKKSKETIGQLYPILEAKDGEIIDGIHREQADPRWKRVRLENIDTEEKKLLARLIANFHRRVVSGEEKAEWINGLAEIYQKHGLEKGEIARKLVDETGLSERTIYNYLSQEYKIKHEESTKRVAVSVAEQIVTGAAKHDLDKQKAQELVERHREEVLAEETPKIKAEIKRELLKSPEFQREVIREISKPQIVKVTDPCPSGVCELPEHIDELTDITAITIAKFWEDYPECQCLKCEYYDKCGKDVRGIIKC